MKKKLIIIVMILISCICFLVSGLMIGFYKGQQHVYDQIIAEEIERERNKQHKVSGQLKKPIIGTPLQERRFKSKLLGNTREVSPDAKQRISVISDS